MYFGDDGDESKYDFGLYFRVFKNFCEISSEKSGGLKNALQRCVIFNDKEEIEENFDKGLEAENWYNMVVGIIIGTCIFTDRSSW